MEINQIVKDAHEMAKLKGWWTDERSALEIHALIHSEVAEATEAVRNDLQPIFYDGKKPEGELVELADVIIRIADWCGKNSWDLAKAIEAKMAYNATRAFKHGKKL